MKPLDDQLRETASLYVLNLLEGDEKVAFEEEIARDSQLADHIVELEDNLGYLAWSSEQYAPPSGGFKGIRERIREEKQLTASPFFSRKTWMTASWAAAACLLIGLGSLLLLQQNQSVNPDTLSQYDESLRELITENRQLMRKTLELTQENQQLASNVYTRDQQTEEMRQYIENLNTFLEKAGFTPYNLASSANAPQRHNPTYSYTGPKRPEGVASLLVVPLDDPNNPRESATFEKLYGQILPALTSMLGEAALDPSSSDGSLAKAGGGSQSGSDYIPSEDREAEQGTPTSNRQQMLDLINQNPDALNDSLTVDDSGNASDELGPSIEEAAENLAENLAEDIDQQKIPATGFAVVNQDARQGFLSVQNLPLADDSFDYQIFITDANSGQIHSPGLLPKDPNGTPIEFPLPEGVNAQNIFVTVEPAGGSDLPTGERVLDRPIGAAAPSTGAPGP